MGELSLRRYEIRRVLGKGGTGTVYEALDTKTNALVALKAVESSVAESLYRLKHEFRALTDVQHQNLVHFGELASEDGKWFFTMELVSGDDFSDYVRPGADDELTVPHRLRHDDEGDVVTKTVLRAWAVGSEYPDSGAIAVVPHSGPTYDERRLRASLAQLIEALSVLHEAGHVHRDIKPSNVLVARDGRLVLLDFGLVTELATREHSAGDMSGTPAFMAPEQVRGEMVGPPADWYAVGVMLYHALTGSLPFSGPVGAVLEAKLERESPAPHERVERLPGDLDCLCVDLLRRRPEDRPSEEEIRTRLGMPARTRLVPSSATELTSGPFVGREREQEVLATALRAVRAGQPRSLVVEGEPGVGKSALVQQFLARISPRPVILTGRCYEQENVPFKGVDSVIDALSAHLLTLSDAQLAVLLAGGGRYLAAVFPVLNRVPAIMAATSAERTVANQAGLREQAFGELSRLCAALARDRLLIVFLDDLQWIDTDSLAVLERAILPQSGTSCLFLATLRSGMEVPRPLDKLRATAERIELGGLSETESRALWDTLRPGGNGTGPDEGALAMREAAGHPLFLAELARAAQAGRFDRHGGALLDVLRERISLHDPTERAFLEMAAVAGAPTPYEIVARAARLDVGECLTRIGGLKAAQLLRVTLQDDDARCIEPYHDRIREAIMEPLRRDGGDRAAQLQLRLGRALLEATPEDRLRERVFTIVQHLNAASRLLLVPSERLRLAELDLLASREARLATAYDGAREYARTGLVLLPEQGWTLHYALCRDLHMARIEAESLAGDLEAARAVFEAARPHMATAEDTALLWAQRVVLETSRGRFREALAAGREALTELGQPLPARFGQAKVLRQYAATRWAQRGRSLAVLERLPTIADANLRGALQLLMACIPAAFFVDTHLLTWLNMRIAEETMLHGVCAASPYGLAGYGLVLAGAFGKREEAEGFGKLAIQVNERVGSVASSARLYMQNAFISHWVRPFSEAKALLRSAHQLAMKHGDAAYEVYSATILSVVSFCESAELGSVQEVGDWAREVAVRRRDRDMAAAPDIHARQAAALRGLTPSPHDLGTAAQSDAALRASFDDGKFPVALFYYHHCNAELAYLAGYPDRAEALLAEAGKRTQGIFALPTMVELVFLQVLVAARRYHDAGRVERVRLLARIVDGVRKLRAWARSCPENYEAHALIATAELERVLGRDRAAERSFRRAAGTARGHGSAKREAMALELAAGHAAARGDQASAARLLKDAAVSYRRWGAVTKADSLR